MNIDNSVGLDVDRSFRAKVVRGNNDVIYSAIYAKDRSGNGEGVE